ncbi:MAG: hypothetical protein K6A72_10440, partial [Lachnospiraceae bacterium]|nr:hypothetical protein [Lachnospiraceae bacterium]
DPGLPAEDAIPVIQEEVPPVTDEQQTDLPPVTDSPAENPAESTDGEPIPAPSENQEAAE